MAERKNTTSARPVPKSWAIILFIDELHTIVGAGSAEGSVDAANILKPALSRGEIQAVSYTHLDVYKRQRHALRRAQPCLVAESLCALTKNREASIVLASLFLAGAEGLEPSARGFGVDVGERTREREKADVIRFPPQVPERAVLVWCCELFLEKDCVSTTTSSFERKAPPPGGWPS